MTWPPSELVRPIGLGELDSVAALQTRVDRKYLVPVERLGALIGLLGDPDGPEPGVRVLEVDGLRAFAYRSVYFDTAELSCYLGAARRRRRRFKVRTRSYLDSGDCWLEVKTRGPRGATVKDRLAYDPAYAGHVAPGRWFVDERLGAAGVTTPEHHEYRVTLISDYRRTTFYLPRSRARVTVDTELCWRAAEERLLGLPRLAVVETKTGSTPSGVDRLLWSRGYRPVRLSKYATALAAFYPELPAAPWRRTLRRCFP